MSSGAGGTPQGHVCVVVGGRVREPSLHFLAHGRTLIDHGFHFTILAPITAHKLIHRKPKGLLRCNSKKPTASAYAEISPPDGTSVGTCHPAYLSNARAPQPVPWVTELGMTRIPQAKSLWGAMLFVALRLPIKALRPPSGGVTCFV
jgi:hypothetical protein